jgi:hypothetical protein
MLHGTFVVPFGNPGVFDALDVCSGFVLPASCVILLLFIIAALGHHTSL